MPLAITVRRPALGLLAGLGLLWLLAAPALAEEGYSPLNNPETYGRPSEAPDNQARFLLAALADSQRLASLELELQTLSVQPNPDKARLEELDRQVKGLREKLDKLASDMGGYVPRPRPSLADCERYHDRGLERGPRNRGGGSRGSGGW